MNHALIAWQWSRTLWLLATFTERVLLVASVWFAACAAIALAVISAGPAQGALVLLFASMALAEATAVWDRIRQRSMTGMYLEKLGPGNAPVVKFSGVEYGWCPRHGWQKLAQH